MNADDEALWKSFREMGEAVVSAAVVTEKWPADRRLKAVTWLTEIRLERERVSAEREGLMVKATQAASRAAWAAAVATGLLAIATIADILHKICRV